MPGFRAPSYLIRQSKVLANSACVPIEQPFQDNPAYPKSRIRLFGKKAIFPMLFYLKNSRCHKEQGARQ
jgi:hypothetical protein